MTVTVWATTPDKADDCAGLGTVVSATVLLESPVGERQILDGGAVPADEPVQR